jgi:hypothetical protein
MEQRNGASPVRNGTEYRTVAAAARILGISERGVRQRISRGTLAAVRTPEGWRVELGAESRTEQTQEQGPERRTVRGTVLPEQGPEHDAVPPLVAALQGEVTFLRTVIERGDQERAELHNRLREAHLLLAQRPALSSGLVESTTPGEAATSTAPRPWWRKWWRWRS